MIVLVEHRPLLFFSYPTGKQIGSVSVPKLAHIGRETRLPRAQLTRPRRDPPCLGRPTNLAQLDFCNLCPLFGPSQFATNSTKTSNLQKKSKPGPSQKRILVSPVERLHACFTTTKRSSLRPPCQLRRHPENTAGFCRLPDDTLSRVHFEKTRCFAAATAAILQCGP